MVLWNKKTRDYGDLNDTKSEKATRLVHGDTTHGHNPSIQAHAMIQKCYA